MLKRLELENFRNYQSLDLELTEPVGLTYLIGDNGQGKTNVLEAIYLLALAKSFRIGQDEKLIKWDQDYGRVKGEFFDISEGQTLSLETFLGKAPQPKRVLKKNAVKVGAADFIGNLQVVFFHPEDLNLLYLGPDLRRRYLDILNIQVNTAYLKAIKKFNKLRSHRNSLLKLIKNNKAQRKDLEIWDIQYAKEAVTIYLERSASLEYLNEKLTEKYREIAQNNDILKLNYLNSFKIQANLMSMADNLEELILKKLAENLERDIASEYSSAGPHRDDFEVLLNEKPIMEHASRGEFRSILLALKLIEIEFYQEKKQGKNPLLLLDDVFSELDHQRQQFLLKTVSKYQTIITTTKDSAIINRENLLAGNFKEIIGGKIV